MSDLKARMKLQMILPLVMVLAMLVLLACSGQATGQTDDLGATETITETGPTNTNAPDQATSAPASAVSFAKDVRPILQSRCLNCHGGQRTEKGLNISTYDHLIAGSEKGPVLVPGDAANSKMIQLIEQGKMPKRGPKVTPDQLAVLIEWINAGAINN